MDEDLIKLGHYMPAEFFDVDKIYDEEQKQILFELGDKINEQFHNWALSVYGTDNSEQI